MKYIALTRKVDGKKIIVRKNKVVAVYPAYDTRETVVQFEDYNSSFEVKESPKTVWRLLEKV